MKSIDKASTPSMTKKSNKTSNKKHVVYVLDKDKKSDDRVQFLVDF